MRSWLFAPGDSERKLAKLGLSGADAVIADLEDAVAAEAKEKARAMVADWLLRSRPPLKDERAMGAQEHTPPHDSASPAAPSLLPPTLLQNAVPQRWVRINGAETAHWRADLAAIMAGAPDGIILPKASGPEQLRLVAQALHTLELQHGLELGSTRIIPLVSETARAALSIAQYADCGSHRLRGLSWGAEDLAVALGASRKKDANGQWTDAFRYVRAQVLLTARACSALPIDTLYADFRDMEGLAAHAAGAFADGFAGMLAIHPAQVPVINAAFTPPCDALAEAQEVVDAFAARPGAGAVALKGRMLDLPHLAEAQRILAKHR